MRVALFLLLLLAVAAVPGSVFPQRRIDTSRVQAYLADHASSGPWLDRLGFFDVYTSPWFSAIYLLLFVSLVGCVVPRTRKHWQAMRAVPPRTPRRLQRMPEFRTGTVDAPPDRVLAAAREVLRRRRYRVAEHDGGASLSAERGYLAETGNLLFHVALLGLLVSVGFGSFFSYSGQVIVVEGERFSNSLPMYNSFSSGGRVDTGDLPPFSFTLDELRVRFEDKQSGQLGAARAFEATTTVRSSPDAAPETRLVQVNHPLVVDGAKAYLTGNGYAPVITVRDGNGAIAFRGPVPALAQDAKYTSSVVVKAPDAAPRQIGLVGTFLPTALLQPGEGWISIFPDQLNPRLVLTAFAGAPGQDGLGVNSGVPQSVYVLDVTKLTQLKTTDGQPARLILARGQSAQLPEGAGSVSFDGIKRYAAFDIHADPSKRGALGASVVALFGVTTSLFVRRRRVWIRVIPAARAGGGGGGGGGDPVTGAPADGAPGDGDADRTVVEVAGLARGEDAGLAAEVKAVLDGAVGQKE
jgi:cytochrome c biogenesis protein